MICLGILLHTSRGIWTQVFLGIFLATFTGSWVQTVLGNSLHSFRGTLIGKSWHRLSGTFLHFVLGTCFSTFFGTCLQCSFGTVCPELSCTLSLAPASQPSLEPACNALSAPSHTPDGSHSHGILLHSWLYTSVRTPSRRLSRTPSHTSS